MSLVSFALRFVAPLPKLENFERYLFIAPHADDIEIGAGATVAKLCEMGKEVFFLICTDGRYGNENLSVPLSPEELVKQRKLEASESAKLLGVKDISFLELSDGGFYEASELFMGISKAISDFQPDIVFAPDPLSISECHIDHLNVGDAARKATCIASNSGIMARLGLKPADVKAIAFYMTAKPNVYVKTAKLLHRQLESIYCHASQYSESSPASNTLKLYLQLRSVDMGLRCFSSAAEGFRVLTKLGMHCLSEAGM